MNKLFNVSEVARQLEKSESWLRSAEKHGKIPRASRDLNGWRVYTEKDIEWLKSLLMPKSKA
jgi:DNA-binding transcriptional MerR regulator